MNLPYNVFKWIKLDSSMHKIISDLLFRPQKFKDKYIYLYKYINNMIVKFKLHNMFL